MTRRRPAARPASDDDPWDDPVPQEAWLDEIRRERIAAYLEAEALKLAAAPEEPAWCVAPYVSLWRIRAQEGRRGWLIAGDLPTDVLFDDSRRTARAACAAFARLWREVAADMLAGRQHPSIQIGDVEDRDNQRELGDLLQRRAATLARWAEDDALWG